MKKFIFFFLLLAAGGTGFFFGWTKLTVPPGSYGVMLSKTHGLEPNIIKDGEFRWIWYKLIPTNVEISVYTIETVKHPIKSSGRLLSGEVYTALAGVEADFSWEINGELNFNIKPESLPAFTARENISDIEGLRMAEKRLAERIGSALLKSVADFIENEDEKMLEYMLIGASLPNLESEIQKNYPEVENVGCIIHMSRYPDFTLYKSVRALYEEYLIRQNASLRPGIAKEAESRIEGRIRLDELTQYGELLTKYPILLQYLALEKGLPLNRIE